MAHSDSLIFLTNITWIFFLFLFIYFFFVLFVLPTFYKKFRTRVLIKSINFVGGVLAIRDILVSFALRAETIRELGLMISSSLNIFSVSFKNLSCSATTILAPQLTTNTMRSDSFKVLNRHSNNLLFVTNGVKGGVTFTRFSKKFR